MQIWARQQAQQIVRARRFGRWEQTQLKEAIRQKVSQTWLPATANLAAVTSALTFLTLTEAIAIMEASLNASESTGNAIQGCRDMIKAAYSVLESVQEGKSSAVNKLLNA
jgi:hypothetical protein